MYAIVKTGGKQYRVEPGQRLLVERLAADVGSTVTLEPLLYRSDEVVLDKSALASVEVSAEVIAHERGEKIRVFKYKPKRGYKRRAGHRQELTRIQVRDITAGSGRRGSSTKAEPAASGAAPKAAEKSGASAAKPKASEAKSPARPRKPKEHENGA